MKIIAVTIFVTLLVGCQGKLLVKGTGVIHKKKGVILFDYNNKIYFIETTPSEKFGRNSFKSAFIIRDFPDTTSAKLLYTRSTEVRIFRSGSRDEIIEVRIAPVEITYVYGKSVGPYDETLIFVEDDRVVVFPYFHFIDLKFYSIELIDTGD